MFGFLVRRHDGRSVAKRCQEVLGGLVDSSAASLEVGRCGRLACLPVGSEEPRLRGVYELLGPKDAEVIHPLNRTTPEREG